MSELLGLTTQEQEGRTAHAMKAAMPSAAGMHAKLVKADFHGSIMTGRWFFPYLRVLFLLTIDAGYDDTARRSKNASLVGVSGIVVQETENTFKVVTRKDKLKGERLPPLFCYVCDVYVSF
jgi:ribonuclease P protein subunit POP4